MIGHLSAEQISRWIAGERTPELEVHVSECGECRSELTQFELTMAQFRATVRGWSDCAAPAAWRRPASRDSWFSWSRLVLAIATLFLLVAIPVYWHTRATERAAEAARADALLLEHVDSSISRAVPEPMEPLVNLVTWNSSPAEMKKKVERQ